jgi:rRNA biogenesis protein RRP5
VKEKRKEKYDLKLKDIGVCSVTSFDTLKLGDVVDGVIEQIHKEWGMYVRLSPPSLADDAKIVGRVFITDLHDVALEEPLAVFHKRQPVKCSVVGIDKEHKKVQLSLRPSVVKSESASSQSSDIPVLPLLNSIDDVQPDTVYYGYVKNVTDKGVWVAVNRELAAFVKVTNLSDEYVKDWKSLVPLGKRMQGRVVSYVIPSSHFLVLSNNLVSLLSGSTRTTSDLK